MAPISQRNFNISVYCRNGTNWPWNSGFREHHTAVTVSADNVSESPTEEAYDDDINAVIYIVVVLLFYSTGIIIAIIMYLKRERLEMEEDKAYDDYMNFRADPDKWRRYFRVQRMIYQLNKVEQERKLQEEKKRQLEMQSSGESSSHHDKHHEKHHHHHGKLHRLSLIRRFSKESKGEKSPEVHVSFAKPVLILPGSSHSRSSSVKLTKPRTPESLTPILRSPETRSPGSTSRRSRSPELQLVKPADSVIEPLVHKQPGSGSKSPEAGPSTSQPFSKEGDTDSKSKNLQEQKQKGPPTSRSMEPFPATAPLHFLQPLRSFTSRSRSLEPLTQPTKPSESIAEGSNSSDPKRPDIEPSTSTPMLALETNL